VSEPHSAREHTPSGLMTQAVSGVSVFERMEDWLFGIFAGFTLLAIIGQENGFEQLLC
jgi:hypothetical protein